MVHHAGKDRDRCHDEGNSLFELEIGEIYETITGILDPLGIPHFSPLGVHCIRKSSTKGYDFTVKVHGGSTFHELVEDGGCITVHFPGYNNLEFFMLAFKKTCEIPGKVEYRIDAGDHESRHAYPVISSLVNYAKCKIHDMKVVTVDDIISRASNGHSQAIIITLDVLSLHVGNPSLIPVKRMHGIFLEGLIATSRMAILSEDHDSREKFLKESMEYLAKLQKLSPNGKLTKIYRQLLENM
ncbi:DUF447 family protein [Candidatus Bathyarchaeota archaeon]|nr:DUF447 family protein [Candidatus Bathyarchaeota archaeon]